MSVSSNMQMSQASSSSRAVSQKVALRAGLDRVPPSPSLTCGNHSLQDRGLDRLVQEMKQCFDLHSGCPDETRDHRAYMAWKSVVMLEKMGAILSLEEELRDGQSGSILAFFDQLRSDGIA